MLRKSLQLRQLCNMYNLTRDAPDLNFPNQAGFTNSYRTGAGFRSEKNLCIYISLFFPNVDGTTLR